jgi:hypothetical protein
VLTPSGGHKLEKLLKDPTKEVYIPSGPKEKTLRPPREMMKNVQGSSAGVSISSGRKGFDRVDSEKKN